MEKAIELYQKYGDNGYIGEKVTQLEHATQCALLAEEYCKQTDKLRNDFILGCLFHDIGHLICFDNPKLKTMGNYGVMNHELVGSNYLSRLGFNKNICDFVENHIKTKRYLITTDPEYYNKLSGASKKTFEFQGGKLSENEVMKFQESKLFEYHLKLRDFDDKAKSTDNDLLDKIKKMNHLEYYSQFL